MNARLPRLLVCLLVSMVATATSRAQLRDGDLVAVCGDSITQQMQYSVMIQEYLLMCQPVRSLNTIQVGWSGERANGFAGRIGSDVLPFGPTVVTTCYGMNDGGYKAVEERTLDDYRQSMTAAVQALKAAGVRTIVVGTPGVVGTATFRRPNCTPEEYNVTLKALAGVAQEVAKAEGVLFADVFTPMMDAMVAAKAKYGETYALAGDGVHPYANGHLPMAYAFLKALGCDGAIGTITVDFAAQTATCDDAQKVLSVAGGAVEIESTRYPYYLAGKAGETSPRGLVEVLPFNQELNRYLLIVKNAPAKTRVTWGGVSREYAGEELAKGINLAADFPEHPFREAFGKVGGAIRRQQAYESTATKTLLHSLPIWQKELPAEQAHLDALQAAVVKKAEAMRQAASALVVPVTHTILIEAAE